MTFNGFDARALSFLTELSYNNEREWFADHKEEYEQLIRKPSTAFMKAMVLRLREVDESWAGLGGKMLRIYRDVRFLKDKTPYNPRIACRIGHELTTSLKGHSPILFVHIGPDKVGIYTGIHSFDRDAMQYYRQMLEDDRRSAAFEDMMKNVEKQASRFVQEYYVKYPRGFDDSHPRAAWLKHKGVMSAIEEYDHTSLVTSADLIDWCAEKFIYSKELYDFLRKM